MPGQHNNGVEMFKILEPISTKEFEKIKRLNGLDMDVLVRAADILIDEKGFNKHAACLEEAFPSVEKLNDFKEWAEKCGPGTFELADDLYKMISCGKILDKCEQKKAFRHWEDKVNQRAWVSYHWEYSKKPEKQMDLAGHFVMVLKYPGMFDKLVAPPIGAPTQIWQKWLTI